MLELNNHSSRTSEQFKERSINECFQFLSNLPQIEYGPQTLVRSELLDTLLNNPKKNIDVILIGGSGSKDSTIFFSSKLLQEEGFNVGIIYASQILSYSERIFINNNPVTNKLFAEELSNIIDISLTENLEPTAFELILMTGLKIFQKAGIEVALVEVGIGGKFDATAILKPIISAVTKVTLKDINYLGKDLDKIAYEMMEASKAGCWFISSEQSKLRLQKMKSFALARNLQWSMPIRKHSNLPFIYSQIFGKDASLAERIVQIYVENIKGSFSAFLRGNILPAKKGKGQRGRPTVEEKKRCAESPCINIKNFWENAFELKRANFELLEKESPTVLLDRSSELSGIDSVLLGIRLLNYKHPISKTIIIAGIEKEVAKDQITKAFRYLFRKMSGEIIFVPLTQSQGHDPKELCEEALNIGLNAKSANCIKSAFDEARSCTAGKNSLICLLGGNEVVAGYWKQVRGIKKI